MILLLGADLFNLLSERGFVGRSLNVADDAERNRESVLVVHHGELQLQSVVKAVSVVHENVFLGDAVLAQLNHLEAEAFLHESVLVVLAEDQRLAVAHVDGVLGASFLLVDRVVAAVVEDYAVLQNLAHRRALVLICSLEDVYGALGVGGNGTCKEVSARSEAQLCRQERVLNGAVRRRLADIQIFSSYSVSFPFT
mgnify:CR=1 FL=1